MTELWFNDKQQEWQDGVRLPKLDETQKEIAKFLVKREVAADLSEAGAGKTLVFLKAWRRIVRRELKNRRARVYNGKFPRLLVISSAKGAVGVAKVATKWVDMLRAYATYTPEGWLDNPKVVVHTQQNKLPPSDAIVVCMSYAYFSQASAASKVKRMQGTFGYTVLDECHYLNGESTRSKNILGKTYEDPNALITGCYYVSLASGTPTETYNDGYFNVLITLFPEFLEHLGITNKWEFLQEFTTGYKDFYTGEWRVTGNKNSKYLKDAMYDLDNSGFAVRRKTPKEHEVEFITISLPVEVSEEVQELNERFSQIMSREEAATHDHEAQAIYTKLSIALGASKLDYLDKYPAHLRIITAAAQGRVLWLAYYKEHLARLSDLVKEKLNRKVKTISGSTLPAVADRYVQEFKRGEIDLVGQIHAMGESINPQEGGHTVVFMEESIIQAKNVQAYQRLDRRGQPYPVVQVYRIRAKDNEHERRQTATKERKAKSFKEVHDD